MDKVRYCRGDYVDGKVTMPALPYHDVVQHKSFHFGCGWILSCGGFVTALSLLLL